MNLKVVSLISKGLRNLGSWSQCVLEKGWRLPMNRKVEGRVPIPCASSLWWGEATDEPVREDARTTNRFIAPMRLRSWRLKRSMVPRLCRQVLECGDGVREVTALALATLFEWVGW